MIIKRSSWISWVDVIAFVTFLLLIATGILLKYVLPPGSGGLEDSGSGWRAANKTVSLVWGLTRHEWGTIHFWISAVFLLAIAAHLFIHWRWIRASFLGKDRRGSRMQAMMGFGALLGLIALAVALILGPKEQIPRHELEAQRAASEKP